jgi:hypothetical protein
MGGCATSSCLSRPRRLSSQAVEDRTGRRAQRDPPRAAQATFTTRPTPATGRGCRGFQGFAALPDRMAWWVCSGTGRRDGTTAGSPSPGSTPAARARRGGRRRSCGPFSRSARNIAILAVAKEMGKTVPGLKPDDTIIGAEAIDIGHEPSAMCSRRCATEPRRRSRRGPTSTSQSVALRENQEPGHLAALAYMNDPPPPADDLSQSRGPCLLP